MQRPQTSIPSTQNKFERFYRGAKNESGDFFVTPGSARPGTPGQNVLARPPSTLTLFNQPSTSTSRLSTISSNSSGVFNTAFQQQGQMNINIVDRPITQHGVAGIRPGTGRGLSTTRLIQDKRYYCGQLQLKIRELNQEIAVIMKDIEEQNKERATSLHYDKRAKDLAAELTTLQGQLADYNIVVDKMTSDIGKEIIEQETEELARKNEQTLSRIEDMFEERKQLEEKLSKIEKQLEEKKRRTEMLIESMDENTKEKYQELLETKTSLQEKANEMQQKLDELYKEQLYLEEEITLSPLKQEAAKLHLKIIEAGEKRDKLREEEKHRISPEEEKEQLMQKIKQDNLDIAAAEAQLSDKKKRIQEAEQELEQVQADMDDVQSEKQVKYKELLKREELIEQFMSTFEQNKEDESKRLDKLEDSIVQYLEKISSMLDSNINFSANDEMAILNNFPVINESEYADNNQSLEKLTKENIKLQQILSEMEILEERLKAESTDLNSKLSSKENELVVLGDLDNLKAKLTLKQEELVAECEQLKQEELKYEQDIITMQSEYDEIRQRLENNDVYLQINDLQNKLDQLMDEYKSVEDFILKEKERGDYEPIKKETLDVINGYNYMLKENLKTIY